MVDSALSGIATMAHNAQQGNRFAQAPLAKGLNFWQKSPGGSGGWVGRDQHEQVRKPVQDIGAAA